MQRAMRHRVERALVLVCRLGLAVSTAIGLLFVRWCVRAGHPYVAVLIGVPWMAMGALLGLSLGDKGRG